MALTITVVNTGSTNGNGTSTTNDTTLTITGVTASVGDVILLQIAACNTGTSGAAAIISSIADNASSSQNDYWLIGYDNYTGGTASDAATIFLYECVVETALSSNTITITFSANNPQKAARAYRIQPGAGETPQLVGTVTFGTGAKGARPTHTLPTTYVQNGDTIFCMAAIETDDTITGDSDTTNGSWSTVQTTLADGGVDTSALSCTTQYKTVNADGAQNWAPTTASGRDSICGAAIYRPQATAGLAVRIGDTGGKRGIDNSSATSKSTTATISAAVGDTLLVCITTDNTNNVTTVTDNASGSTNSYVQRGTTGSGSSGGDGAYQYFFECVVTTALSNNTITVNFDATQFDVAINVIRMRPYSADYRVKFSSVGTPSGGNVTSHSASAIDVDSGFIVFGMAGIKTNDAITGDTDTTNGTWAGTSIYLTEDTAGTTDNLCVADVLQWKQVTATGSQSWACSTASARVSARNVIVYEHALLLDSLPPIPNIPPFQHMMMR